MTAALYSLTGHTADIGLRVKAKTLRALFARSARAIFELSFGKTKNSRGKERIFSIRIKGQDIEELFVNWLNELLSLSQAKGVVFSSFKIEEISPQHLFARAVAFSYEGFLPEKEIKAATYHRLRIRRSAGYWRAQCILDV